ncbi:MazG family protein [Ornithinimicrobium sediminis]|uniref:MazG family protein n=1 Tax=Ornithinimicrobium sediminis TaxID=2904603 RepID=UPI001E560EDB|nr:MazG family protein [Ornithinimicrobium sediminis]
MDRTRRVILLLTSPRVAPGLLSRQAWRALEGAGAVLARDAGQPLVEALQHAGVTVEVLGAAAPDELARRLLDRSADQEVVWVGSADADPGLAEALAAELTRREEAPELEVLVGSWDVPGARLLDAVAVMDRLRSPGGCPWDAEQTHTSLTPYLVEEAYEAVESLESGDREHMAEELGDVLLQVLFHARVALEHDEDPFDIDDVAAALVAKLVRRHPHVFARGERSATTPQAVEASWEQLKAAEKPHREHVLDGIPVGMPELARAAKVASRLERAGRGGWLRGRLDERAHEAGAGATAYGAAVMDLVLRARAEDVDLPAALRALLRDLAAELEA